MTNERLHEEIEGERLKYENNEYGSLSQLTTRFKWCFDLLHGQDSSKGKSRANQSKRRRARNIIMEINDKFDFDVLLLFATVTNIAKISALDLKGLVPQLQKWWRAAVHPEALSAIANQVRDKYPSQFWRTPETQLPCKRRKLASTDETRQTSPTIIEQCLVTLENSIWSTAPHIPRPQDRDAFIRLGSTIQYLFVRFSSDEGSQEKTLKRKYSTDQPVQAPNVQAMKAVMPYWDASKSIVGEYLFMGMQMSRQRLREGLSISVTNTESLYMAPNAGEDFKLELWLCSSMGEAIANEIGTAKTYRTWKKILGDFLFAAMEESIKRKEEDGTELTGAVILSFPGGVTTIDDCKLEVWTSFEAGCAIWKTFPRDS